MIDILLSTYNGEKYLKEQIDSILAQSYSNIHLIIRDDGSKDTTNSILNEYKTKNPQKITLLEDHKNLGAMHSFEALLKESQAEYCMFADQDDMWLPKKVEHALNAISQKEAVVGKNVPILAYSDLQVVDQDLNVINPSFFQHTRINPQLSNTFYKLAVNNCVTGCTMIMNDAARKVSLPLGNHALMHDVWVALSVLANNGEIILLPDADILYRQHGKNVLGAVSLQYNSQYFLQKLRSLNKVFALQKALHDQATDICPYSWPHFLWNRILYLLKR